MLHLTTRPRPCHHRPGRHRPRAGSLCSTTLPHRGYVGGPVSSAGTVSRSLVSSPSRWLLRTIRLGYAIQFARCPPQVQGHPVHFNQDRRCPCLACGIRSLAGERNNRTGPSSRYEVRVLQPLLHCAQQKRWVTTDLGSASFDPRALQAAVQDVDAEKHFRACPSPRLVCSNRPEGHDSILPRNRAFLQFAFEGRACQYKLLPFGHLSQLGFQVNWEKSKLVPMQRISFLGMELDSFSQTARLTQERAQSVLNCLKTLSGRTAVPLKLFQRLLGHMAAAAAIVPLGLLHIRLLQHWLHGRIPRWAWKCGTHRFQITPACRKTFSPWSDPSFLRLQIREGEEQVLLVAPYWPNRTWFPELMFLATAPPWPIPLRKDLLSQRRGTLWHPRPDLWKLHVWFLDGTRRF